MVQSGADAGEPRRGLDIAAIAAFYVTERHGTSIQAVDGASRETLEQVGIAAMAAWDRLVAAPGG